jgi:hypothetical protein
MSVGSRNKLGEGFLADLYADWREGGIAAIARVRVERPDVYLRVASILPKQLEIKDGPFDGFTDEQLAALLAAARDALGISEESAAERPKGAALQRPPITAFQTQKNAPPKRGKLKDPCHERRTRSRLRAQ